jgi:hypothetical protein
MLLSKVRFKVVGKQVHPSLLRGKIRDSAAGTAKNSIPARIEQVHCTVHDQSAKAVLKATTEEEFNYESQGRYNELIKEVERLLGA